MLIGERIVLRALRRADLALLCQFNNDLEVELAGGGDPPMPQSLERLTAEFEAQAQLGGRDGTNFAIEVAGEFIGQCALFNIDKIARTAELGITIGNKDYWGRGYGKEAIGLLIEYGFRHLNLHRIFLKVNGRNLRAIRAYRACGFVEEGRLLAHVWSDGAYDDQVLMGLLQDAWGGNKV